MKTLLEDIFMSRNLNNIQRYSLVRTIKDQSVAEHSYGVTVLSSLILKDIKSSFIETFEFLDNAIYGKCIWNAVELYSLKSSLYHDLGEAVTGDVTYPFKHSEHFSDQGERNYVESQFKGTVFEDLLPLLLDFSEQEELGRIKYFSDLLPTVVQDTYELEDFRDLVGSLDCITKFCDCLELLIYTYEEIKSGNTFIEPIWREGTKILNSKKFSFILGNSNNAIEVLKSLSIA